jgi:uncharacterized OB-fold protein
MGESMAKPVPQPTEDSRPYWEGLARGELLVQRCRDCGKLRHYPRPVCDGCWSMAHEWVALSGRGAVHSWTVCHHPFHIGFKAQSPYVLVTVELEEGVRALGQWRGEAAALRLGLPVRAGFEREGEGPVLPVFHPKPD